MTVAVVLESWAERGGGWNPLSFEALAAATQLASASGETPRILAFPGGVAYTSDTFTAALESWIRKHQPAVVLFPHSYQVRDYAPRLAARFGRALLSDVVGIDAQGIVTRQLFQGKLNAELRPAEGVAFLSVQAGAFRPVTLTAELERLPLASSETRTQSDPPFRPSERTIDLTAAERIVAVGRGIRDEASLNIVRELAAALGAELAASRPVCDNGWLPIERQIGSSGQTVAPKLYLALGISGAIQHLVGMKGSKVVVAVNQDESAPIFEMADYGVVADLFALAPALTAALKNPSSSGA